MFEEKNQEQVVEETTTVLDNNNTQRVSVDDAPASPAEKVAEIKDYLAPELFNEIRVVNKSCLLYTSDAADE